MKNVIIVFLLIMPSYAISGDYMLYIADKDNTNLCSKNKSSTSSEIINSMNQYFSGKSPEIGILRAAFSNGHFHFCGSNEVTNVLNSLYNLKRKGVQSNKNHINDYD